MRGWAILVVTLAIGGCVFGPVRSRPAPPRHWWQDMGDAQLSRLIERGLAKAPLSRDAQVRLPGRIAQAYIDLRAQQATLVLLARREELDAQLVDIARQDVAGRTVLAEAAFAQLMATRSDQLSTRDRIQALRDDLTALASAAPDALVGGPIPLPPAQAAPDDRAGRYNAARIVESLALTHAEQACAISAQRLLQVRAGTLPPADARISDLQALDALQADEQARAAMSQAYVAEALVRATAPAP